MEYNAADGGTPDEASLMFVALGSSGQNFGVMEAEIVDYVHSASTGGTNGTGTWQTTPSFQTALGFQAVPDPITVPEPGFALELGLVLGALIWSSKINRQPWEDQGRTQTMEAVPALSDGFKRRSIGRNDSNRAAWPGSGQDL